MTADGLNRPVVGGVGNVKKIGNRSARRHYLTNDDAGAREIIVNELGLR